LIVELTKYRLKYTNDQWLGVEKLLCELFPVLHEALDKDYRYGYTDKDYNSEYYQEKRICSPDYFKRYFSYTVLKGQISDNEFNEFINKIESLNEDQIINEFNKFFHVGGENEFMQKIERLPNTTDWKIVKKIIIGFTHIGYLFSKHSYGIYSLISDAYSKAGLIITKLLKDHIHESDITEFSTKLIAEAPSLDFAMEINTWMRSGNQLSDKMFEKAQYDEMANILISRAIQDSAGSPIFIKYPDHTPYLFGAWHELNPHGFFKYLNEILESNSSFIVDLLKSYTPRVTSTIQSTPYLSDFKRNQYEYLSSVYEPIHVRHFIFKAFSGDELTKENAFWTNMQGGQTDINLVRQYLHWDSSKDEPRVES
jgi:hypothetical protein